MCVALCSCSLITFGGGSETTDSVQDTQTTAPEEEPSGISGRLDSARAERDAALSAVPEGDFDGMIFLFVCSDTYAAFGDGDGELSLSREKYARIQMLNQRLNTDIVIIEASYDEMQSGLRVNADSGMMFAHMVQTEVFRIGPLAQAGLLGNVSALPFIDLTKPYYDSAYCEEMTTPSGLYSVYGDACLDMNKISAVYYNTRLASEIGIEGLEESVRSGEWTLDMMAQYVKLANDSADVGSYTGAVIPETDEFLRKMYVASGMKSTADDGTVLTLADNREMGDAVTAKLRELLPNTVRDTDDEASAEQIFYDGGALFYIANLSGALDFYNMPDVWGVLPMPTVNGGTDYRSAAHLYTQVVCYPSTGVKATESYLMIESLFASSYGILNAAMRDDYLHRYARNETALDMLSYVTRGVSFDLLDAYSDSCPAFRVATRIAFEQSSLDDTPYSVRFDAGRAAAEKELAGIKKQ